MLQPSASSLTSFSEGRLCLGMTAGGKLSVQPLNTKSELSRTPSVRRDYLNSNLQGLATALDDT